MSKNLRIFLNELLKKYQEEIMEVDREVDPRFELTSIAAESKNRKISYSFLYVWIGRLLMGGFKA